MLTKKIYPVGKVKMQNGEEIFVIEKTVAEYRVFGILILRKEIVSPCAYSKYSTEFFTQF